MVKKVAVRRFVMKQCSVHDGAMVSSSSGQWTGHVTWAFVLETAVCPAHNTHRWSSESPCS